MQTSNASPEHGPQVPLYSPLQSPNIRLISFADSEGDAEIAVSLLEAPLTEDLEYHALSYVWGDGVRDKTIRVNGHLFQVSTHLHNFLKLARSDSIAWSSWLAAFPSQTSRDDEAAAPQQVTKMRWWIDAICLDQTNIVEKAQEVPRMGEIYSFASQVWIWYGLLEQIFGAEAGALELYIAFWAAINIREATDTEDLYIQEMARLEQDLSKEILLVGSVAHAEGSSNDVYKPRQEPLHESTSALRTSDCTTSNDISGDSGLVETSKLTDADARRPSAKFILRLVDQLSALSKHPYFARTWVIQEFLLAGKAPIALIGEWSFHQQTIGAITPYLQKMRNILTERVWVKLFGAVCMISQATRLNIAYIGRRSNSTAPAGHPTRSSPAVRLLYYLLLFANKECTVAHDLFYSMLGLLDSGTLPKALLPDYLHSFTKVSWDYTSYILQETKDLRLLGRNCRELSDCPTWVPDVRDQSPQLNTYESASMTNGTVSVSSNGRELHVEGSEVGKVLKCSCQADPEDWGEGNLSYIRDVLLVEAAQIKSQTTQVLALEWLNVYYLAKDQHALAFGEPCGSIDNLIATFRTQCSHIAEEELVSHGLPLPELLEVLGRSSCPNPDILKSICSLTFTRWCLLDTGDIILCGQSREAGVDHMPGDAVWALKNSYSLALLHPRDRYWEYKGQMHQWELPAEPGTRRALGRYDDSVQLDEEYFASRKVQNLILV
jgi:hypothetical protein